MQHKELEKAIQLAFTRTIESAKERAKAGYFHTTIDITGECERYQNFEHQFFVYLATKGFLVAKTSVTGVLIVEFSDKSWYTRTDVIKELNQLAHQKDVTMSEIELRALYLEWLGQIQEARNRKCVRMSIDVSTIHPVDKKQLKDLLTRDGFTTIEIDKILRISWVLGESNSPLINNNDYII